MTAAARKRKRSSTWEATQKKKTKKTRVCFGLHVAHLGLPLGPTFQRTPRSLPPPEPLLCAPGGGKKLGPLTLTLTLISPPTPQLISRDNVRLGYPESVEEHPGQTKQRVLDPRPDPRSIPSLHHIINTTTQYIRATSLEWPTVEACAQAAAKRQPRNLLSLLGRYERRAGMQRVAQVARLRSSRCP
jgi:hypothetical protein